MEVQVPLMFVCGLSIAGWIVPEFISAIMKNQVPCALNWIGAAAGFMISGSFVF